jgi:hypothetical protein
MLLNKKVEQDLLVDIISKKYKEFDFIPSESSVAKQYDVSVNTARKALDSLKNKNILFRVPNVGTFVSPVGTCKTVIILFSNEILSNHNIFEQEKLFFLSIYEHTMRHRLPFNIQFFSSDKISIDFVKNLKFMFPDIMGLIFFRCAELLKKYRSHLDDAKIPFVFYGSDYNVDVVKNCNTFMYSEKQIVYTGLNYLYRKGHRNIGFLYSKIYRVYLERLSHFVSWHQEQNLNLTPASIIEGSYEEVGEHLNKLYLSGKLKMSAVLGAADAFVCPAIQKLSISGCAIPETLTFLGINNSPICNYILPGISSVKIPWQQDAVHVLQVIEKIADDPDTIFNFSSEISVFSRHTV